MRKQDAQGSMLSGYIYHGPIRWGDWSTLMIWYFHTVNQWFVITLCICVICVCVCLVAHIVKRNMHVRIKDGKEKQREVSEWVFFMEITCILSSKQGYISVLKQAF